MVGGGGFWVVHEQLRQLENSFAASFLDGKVAECERQIMTAANTARQLASLFAKQPAVIAAYQLALSGDLNDPFDAAQQRAREQLRRDLADSLDGYTTTNGKKLAIHFHLPNAHSLLRAWHDKTGQTRWSLGGHLR